MTEKSADIPTMGTKPIVGNSKGIGERIFEKVLAGCGSLSVLITVGIVGTLIFETANFFSEVSF